jgi:hypothetical protein
MSDLMNATQVNFRRHLLTSASAFALLASLYGARDAHADDADHPTVWIEVGGGFEQISAGETRWLPPNLIPPITNPQPMPFGKLPAVGLDVDFGLSFTPENSDWVYSASISYGRALRGPKHSHDQTYQFHSFYYYFKSKYVPDTYNFSDATQKSRSSRAIIDFKAGKDIGLGSMGGKSVISAGIRILKLNERSEGQFTAFTNAPKKYDPGEIAHKAGLLATHSFSGIGPSISWDASAPLMGSLANGFSIDWGANAAILFGRQKTDVTLHANNIQYYHGSSYMSGVPVTRYHFSPPPMPRAKNVVVPNVGGFAGLSWHLPNAKLSLGYRADFFFGAIDGGLDSAKKETRGFYGPFANVSVGLGG